MSDLLESPAETAKAPARRPRDRRRPRTAQASRQWRRRMAGYVLAAAAFILFVNVLVGENGYLATVRAQRDASTLEQELRQVRAQNQLMRERIQRLKTDPAAVEEEARRELHLSKPGETMVVIQDGSKAK